MLFESRKTPNDIPIHTNHYYEKKEKGVFRAPYNNKLVDMNDDSTKHIHKMIDKLTSKHNVDCMPDYYIVNIVLISRDVCKHVHAAQLYSNIGNDIETNLVT